MLNLNILELCKETHEYYSRLGNANEVVTFDSIRDSIDEDFQMWLNYFLELSCTSDCIETALAYLPADNPKKYKASVARELGVHITTVEKRMKDVYRVVNFCNSYFKGVKFMCLEERVKGKIYDRIYMRELLTVVENNTARGCYINALARAGVVTLEDLLGKSNAYLLKSSRISEKLLVILTKRLQSLGISDFNYIPKHQYCQ